MEYLELVLLISLVASAYQYGKGTKELQDKVDDLEGKLDGVEKLLIDLQPKSEPKIPVRLSKEIVDEVLPTLSQEELNNELQNFK